MKILKRLYPYLILCLSLFLVGCAGSDKQQVKNAVSAELNVLKHLDSDEGRQYLSLEHLLPADSEYTISEDQLQELFLLFYHNFDYRINNIQIHKDRTTASVHASIQTLDARTLASDYAAQRLEKEIQALSTGTASQTVSDSYLLLSHLLTSREYESIKQDAVLSVVKQDGKWQLEQSVSNENVLVGGLITYLQSSDLLTPEATISVYLNAIKQMSPQELSTYLGLSTLLDSDNADETAIAERLLKKVHSKFNYSILDQEIDGLTATVTADITTFDSNSILEEYERQMEDYLASADAVIDGEEVRQRKARAVLLEIMDASDSVTTSTITFQLYQDGNSWKLTDPSAEFGDAIFGEQISDSLS